MKVAVGSKNPVKIAATKAAFKKVWPEEKWEVVGVDVPSGVPDQPMSDAESLKGATQRAQRALKREKADYGVGLEGGFQKVGKYWVDGGWMVVLNKKGEKGIGVSARVETPPKMMKFIHKGKELGDVSDIFFDTENSKQSGGHFGLMTNDLITRTHGYKDGLIMALSRFLHPEVW